MEADPKVDSPHVAEELPVSNIPRETALPQSADSVKKADANPGTTIKQPTEIKLDFGMSAQDIDIAYKPEVKFDNPKQLLRERTDLEEVLTYKVFDDENQRVLPLNPAAELLGEGFTAKRTELILEIQAEKEFLFSELEIPESEFEPTSLIELIESGGTEDKELSLDGIYASLDADIEPLAVVEINDVDDQEGETGSATGRLEAVIIKLAERVEVADPDMAEELDEIAQQIIEVPVQPITTDKQEAEIEEEPASTKLAALSYDFAQTLGVELEPVEATSLAHLIIRLKKEGKLPTPSHEKGAVDQGYGTHELLSGLLISLADSRKVTYLSTLGSWTLRLFWHPELVAA
jgi:hypothetical protein